MKRKFFISFIALATVVLVSLSIIPHHHHNEVACMEVEVCENKNFDKDIHNSPDKGENHLDLSCVAEKDYINPRTHDIAKCKCSVNDHIHLFPVIFLALESVFADTNYSFPKQEYDDGLLFYKSAEANQFHGLRAPPRFLS